jgi:tRNA-specific adenosine deaminase 1
MYCSEAPCGDASMELVMDAQEDATPWTSPPPTISAVPSDTTNSPDSTTEAAISALRGRSNFSALGLVRLKPSRPDAPPTLSKSCTDKLALCQGTSLLSSVSSLLIHPSNAYITSLILPSSQYVPKSIERAFSSSGRLAGMSERARKWKGGYVWKGFDVKTTEREFMWSRRSVLSGQKSVASNLSAVYTPGWTETLIGGVLQGRKQLDPRGASRVCRRRMWGVAVKVAAVAGGEVMVRVLEKERYKDVKTDEVLVERRKVKEDVTTGGLNGWVKNTGDEDFSLDDTAS